MDIKLINDKKMFKSKVKKYNMLEKYSYQR